ncbi:MAG: dual specificity protein phosphatase family protein [Nanoarchaeota archaeon]
MNHELKFEFDEITPCIFIGTNLCCIPKFKPSLLKKGIRADISLEEENLDSQKGVQYYLWLPTKDFHPPSQKQLILGVKFLDMLIKRKIKTYVHCKYGHGRSPALIAAYFIYKGLTLEKAIKKVSEKRPLTHLSSRQIKALKKFEKIHSKL